MSCSERRPGAARRGLAALELAVAVAVIGGFVCAAAAYQRLLVRRAHEVALRADLQALRAGVAFFEARRGGVPRSLEELAAQPIGRLRRGEEWHNWSLQDRGQRLTDAFGRPYAYDPATGRVWSTAAGYEKW